LPRPPIAYHVEQLVERPPVHTLITEDVFLGGVLDTGAQKSVSGLAQDHAYCKTYNLEMHLTEGNGKFIFGDTVCRSLGRCRLLVPTPDGDKTVDAHVVEGNIPFLIGLDTIDVHGWNVLTVENQIHSKREWWHTPLEQKLGHIFLTWDPSYHTRYTRHQLQSMHLNFMHPSNTKLFNLLERAYP
jgi:hypothetical protein